MPQRPPLNPQTSNTTEQRLNRAQSIVDKLSEKHGRLTRQERRELEMAEKTVKEIQEQQGMTRRGALKVLAGGAAVLGTIGIGAYLGLNKPNKDVQQTNSPVHTAHETKNEYQNLLSRDESPKYNYSKIQPPELKEKDGFKRMLEIQEIFKQRTREALGKFSDHPKVKELLKFLDDNAYYSVPTGPDQSQHFLKPDEKDPRESKNHFEVVYMPQKYAENMRSSALTLKKGRLLRIASEFRIMEWMGLVLTHELSHVHDLLIGKENPKNKDEYLNGELKAHLLEMELLKMWSPQAYKILINKGTPLYLQKRKNELRRLIESLYPATGKEASQNEVSLAIGSCLAAIAIEHAKKTGKTKKEMIEIYKQLISKEWYF